jgi:tetratricopeptide (TPR) repeat protein
MTKIRFSLILGLFLFVISLSSVDAQDLKLVARYVEMNQFNHAKSLLLPEAQTSSDQMVLFTIAKVYQSESKIDSANFYFSKVIAVNPGSPLSLIAQIIIDYNSNTVTDAANFYKAEKGATSAKNLFALTQISEFRFLTGDTNNWKEPLDKAINIDRKYVKAYILAGDIYTKIAEKTLFGEDYGKASGRYEQALYYAPDNSEAKTKLSYIYYLARNYFRAEQALSEVLTKDSLYIPALKAMGELEYIIGKYSQASYYFGKYISLAENTSKDLSKYINILYFNKEYAKSNDLIAQSLVTDTENAVLLRLKGYTSYELKKYKEGLEAMTKFFSLRSDPGSDKIILTDYEYYGKLLSRNGEDSLAVINLNKALAMDTTKNYLYEDLAKSWEKLKNYPEAVNSYDKLIASGSKVGSGVYFNKGLALNYIASDSAITKDTIQFKQYILLADSAFSYVAKLSPNSHLGYLYRARMQSRLDPESELGIAKPHYDSALRIIEAKNDSVKFKNEILEIYRYLGYYHYLQYLSAKDSKDSDAVNANKQLSMLYWRKIISYDPKDRVAIEALKVFK